MHAHQEDAPRHDTRLLVRRWPVEQLQVGCLLAVVDQPHHVAVCPAVDVLHHVAQSCLGLHRAIIKAHDVLEVIDAVNICRAEAAPDHLDHDAALRDAARAAHAPPALATSRVESFKLRVRHARERRRKLVAWPILDRRQRGVWHRATSARRTVSARCANSADARAQLDVAPSPRRSRPLEPHRRGPVHTCERGRD